jgi:hypothetical protein
MAREPEKHEPWVLPFGPPFIGCSCGGGYAQCVAMGRAA